MTRLAKAYLMVNWPEGREMANFQRRLIVGRWREGYALDLHTLTSIFTGHDEFGHPRFESTRSEVGELLYRLKYSHDRSVVDEIAETAATLMKEWQPNLDVIVPVPASTRRAVQPVILLANAPARSSVLPSPIA
jgi:competence protein ComFC